MRGAARRLLLLLAVLLPAAAASAQTPAQIVVSSAGPDRVALTVYRDPARDKAAFIDDDADEPLKGYALITETRIVDLPPGRVTVRFEGVASGIQPETAILVGGDPSEKNQDRLLLSERGLIDAFTGQQVTLRRTDAATGKVVEERARIRSSSDGIILETTRGFEAVRCTGLSQTLLYPGVPPGLSAKPVLSMALDAGSGGRRTLTLSYLAADFDWQANYVGHLSADTGKVDLFAWITLASRDDVSFANARTAAVAGKVARVTDDGQGTSAYDDEEDYYSTTCWPQGTTGSPPYTRPFGPDSYPELLARMAERDGDDDYGWGGGGGGEDIIVTGTRIARQEDLGDLKLYRVPFPVTVAANAQKQVALLSAKKVEAELIYRTKVHEDDDAVEWLLRVRNRKGDGLGLPLPRGQIALFQQGFGRPMLLGETAIEDKAVGEEVEFVFAEAQNVSVDAEYLEEVGASERHRLTVANANPFPIRFEAEFQDGSYTRYDHFSGRIVRRNGMNVWRVEIAAGGRARLDYRETDIEEEDDLDEETGA